MFVPNISEAAAVRLIKTILFGRPLPPPHSAPLIQRPPCRSPRAPSSAPANPFEASNAEFFRTIVLRKRITVTPRPPVTPVPTTIAPPSQPFLPLRPLVPPQPLLSCRRRPRPPCRRHADPRLLPTISVTVEQLAVPTRRHPFGHTLPRPLSRRFL